MTQFYTDDEILIIENALTKRAIALNVSKASTMVQAQTLLSEIEAMTMGSTEGETMATELYGCETMYAVVAATQILTNSLEIVKAQGYADGYAQGKNHTQTSKPAKKVRQAASTMPKKEVAAKSPKAKLPRLTFKHVKKYQGGIKTWTSVWNVYTNDVPQMFTVKLTDSGYVASGFNGNGQAYPSKIQAARAYLA